MERISLTQAVEDSGLKKQYVADKLGITRSYLNEYLSHPDRITIKNATILSKLTGKSINELDFNLDERT